MSFGPLHRFQTDLLLEPRMVECMPIRGVYPKYESMESAIQVSNEDASALDPMHRFEEWNRNSIIGRLSLLISEQADEVA